MEKIKRHLTHIADLLDDVQGMAPGHLQDRVYDLRTEVEMLREDI